MKLYLIGYRGSGKSTVAPLVATELDRQVIDSDHLIEAAAQKSIAEIFASEGEDKFRKLEQITIAEIEQRTEALVVSLGGGAPMFPANQAVFKRSGKTVWLKADADELWRRISGDDSTESRRPNLTDQGGREEVESLLEIRNPVYEACADYTVNVGTLTPQEAAEAIVHWWNSADSE